MKKLYSKTFISFNNVAFFTSICQVLKNAMKKTQGMRMWVGVEKCGIILGYRDWSGKLSVWGSDFDQKS